MRKKSRKFSQKVCFADRNGYIECSEVGTEGPSGVRLSFREGPINSVQTLGGGLFNLRAATWAQSALF
jgi:hypothetical protein